MHVHQARDQVPSQERMYTKPLVAPTVSRSFSAYAFTLESITSIYYRSPLSAVQRRQRPTKRSAGEETLPWTWQRFPRAGRGNSRWACSHSPSTAAAWACSSIGRCGQPWSPCAPSLWPREIESRVLSIREKWHTTYRVRSSAPPTVRINATRPRLLVDPHLHIG